MEPSVDGIVYFTYSHMSNITHLFSISPQSLDLLPGLRDLVAMLPDQLSSGGIFLRFDPSFSSNGFRITKAQDDIEICYARPCDAYRALGVLLSRNDLTVSGVFEEACSFDSLGVTDMRVARGLNAMMWMCHLLEEVLPQTISATLSLWRLHKSIWHEWYKPFGWEMLDRRYAGVASRLETLRELLERYMSNPAAQISEFEYETHRIHPESPYPEMWFGSSRRATASWLK